MPKAAKWSGRTVAETWLDLAGGLAAWGPPLAFGLRLWASVCIALYVAFWLELDNAYWAGTSAALVCQPQLGASLRKGWFRMIGTIVGAVAVLVLTACFPQDRVSFLVGLVLWGGACALVATVLRNFAAYAAALSGYSVAIIAGELLGATGGVDGNAAFMLAVTRVSEICIGIVSAGVVLASTDLGGSRRRLATLFADLATGIAANFVATLASAGPDPPDTRPARRDFIRRVIALDPVIDQTIGESSQIRYHTPVLQKAADGLLSVLSAWRAVAEHLVRLPDDQTRTEALAVLQRVPSEVRSLPQLAEPSRWMADAVGLHLICEAAGARLLAVPVGTPAQRLFADKAAEAMLGLSEALNGLALLVRDPARPVPRRPGIVRLRVPDWLPALVNAGRTCVTIGAAALFWIITGWPNGSLAITFTAITVILLSPRADQAYAIAVGFAAGTILAAACAAIVAFAVLPQVLTFFGFSLALGAYLVPVGALMARPWQTALFVPMAANFVPLLAPANQMTYDPGQFYNATLALTGGCVAGALAFRLLPPLSPAFRTRRLLALALRDLRRLAAGRIYADWEGSTRGRLSALPEAATPQQRAELLAALSAGSEITRLRSAAGRLGLDASLDPPLAAIARGSGSIAITHLRQFDAALAARGGSGPEGQIVLRARASILVLSDVLTDHADYFARGVSG